MGHNIGYLSFKYTIPKNNILSGIQEWARNNCDRQENPSGDYYNKFKFEDYTEFKTREEAEKYLSNLKAYDDRGVIYYEYPENEPTSSLKKLKESEQKIREQALKFANEHSIQKQKSKMIGCKSCGSTISKEYIGSRIDLNHMGEFQMDWGTDKYKFHHFQQECPVCHKDLRAEYIQQKLDEYAVKLNDILAKEKEEQNKQNSKNIKKATKMWLCKVEVSA